MTWDSRAYSPESTSTFADNLKKIRMIAPRRTKCGVHRNRALPNNVFSGLRLLFVGVGFLAAASSAVAENDGKEAHFKAESLRLRSALHFDPLLDDALDTLVKLYVGAGRSEELVRIYRNHVSEYPGDNGAKTVLARILRRLDRRHNAPERALEGERKESNTYDPLSSPGTEPRG